MSCGFEEDLTAYVDRELPPLRLRQVEEHLPSCPGCAEIMVPSAVPGCPSSMIPMIVLASKPWFGACRRYVARSFVSAQISVATRLHPHSRSWRASWAT